MRGSLTAITSYPDAPALFFYAADRVARSKGE